MKNLNVLANDYNGNGIKIWGQHIKTTSMIEENLYLYKTF